MSVVQSIEDAGLSTKELVIEVPKGDVEAEVARITKDLRGQVRIPGFRVGKVPLSLVKSRFKSEIESEVIERLVPKFWEQAKKEKELDTLIAPRVEDVQIKDGETMTFKAVVEVRPEIDLDSSREFELPSGEVLVGEAEVDEIIERIQNDLATFDAVERAASHGDQVRIKIRETPTEEGSDDNSDDSDGAAPVESEAVADWQEITVELGDQRVWEELSLAATGLEAGGKSDFSHQDPAPPVEEGEDPIAASPPRHFQLEVVEVLEKQLAEADDELAKKVSEFETIGDLRADVEKRIFADKKEKRGQERESRLMEQLTERNPLELPDGVVAEEIQSMMRNYAERLAKGGVDVEKAGMDWNKISEEMAPQAKQRVHAQLVLDAVAKEDGLEVPEGQLSALVVQIARARGKSLGEVQDELNRTGGIDTVREDLLRQRTVRHLLGEPLDVDPLEEHVHGPDCDHDHDHSHDHAHNHDGDSEEE